MKEKTIAVFPIPGLVAFPGQDIPLHIFEPRYRQMVEDSLETGQNVGLCIPAGVISKASDRVSKNDSQFKNLSMFRPQKIMGSGKVELLESLDDGRYHINVKILEKVEIQKVVTETPYCLAEVIVRNESIQNMDYARRLHDELMGFLLQVIGQRKEVLSYLGQGTGDLESLIRNIVSFLYFPVEVRQLILEESFFEKKAEIILTYMQSLGNQQ